MNRMRLIIVVGVLALLAAACGGASEPVGTQPAAPSAVASETTADAPQPTGTEEGTGSSTTTAAAQVVVVEPVTGIPDSFPIPIPNDADPNSTLGYGGFTVEYSYDVGRYADLVSLYRDWLADEGVDVVFDEVLGSETDPGRHQWSGYLGSDVVIVRIFAKVSTAEVQLNWYPTDGSLVGIQPIPDEYPIALPDGGVVTFVERANGGDATGVSLVYRSEQYDDVVAAFGSWFESAGAVLTEPQIVKEAPNRRATWLGTLDNRVVFIMVVDTRDGLVSATASWGF